jgi:UDP-N-acetylglucosamine--N-acetylmuramyl-(pentapeptide) pyrophosphoryl-undecaprenol N-acetylglucosamine transferase
MEMEKVPQAGYKIVGLDIAGFNRSNLLKNLTLPFKLVKSFLQVRSIFQSFRPDAAFGVGGYSSFPVLRFAQAKGIPTFLHESNAFAGKSNILLGKKAKAVFVAVPGMEKFFPAEKIKITGNPVRAAIAHSQITHEEACRYFGLDAQQPVVLAMGGSLGARSINLAMKAGLGKLTTAGIQVIWQTGKLFIDEAREATAGKAKVWVSDFIGDMAMAYAAADVVISRSGAMSVSELCLAGKPAVFVPYPHAAEDHQTANAMALVDRKGALLIRDAEAKEKLVEAAIDLALNPPMRQSMAANMRVAAIWDADKIIAQEILKSLHA